MCLRTSAAIATVCSVLPVAMTSDARNAPSIVILAAKLPSQTAGHSRLVARSSAATAMPEGGQTAVA